MATAETDLLEDLWSGVIDSISQDSPQNRAFLTLTKPLGLLKSEGGSNLLLAAPNGFAKDVLESRLKVALNDALSA
ncbi:MAG: DnaA N-terminal domain-containing protein, partial [Actinomycetota bacterium]